MPLSITQTAGASSGCGRDGDEHISSARMSVDLSPLAVGSRRQSLGRLPVEEEGMINPALGVASKIFGLLSFI
jgi:hypothetical protein